MVEDRIEQAIEMATTGDPAEAIRLLWPVLLDWEERDQAIFALAFCFEKSNNFATANYLYEELILHHPAFDLAVEHQQTCRKMVEERGLIEDFQDIGHRDCLGCTFRYRSEYILCPYCDTPKDSKEPSTEKQEAPEEKLPGWKDPSILDTIEGFGRDAADRIQDFVESDIVKDISDKVVSASVATGRKAKELAKSRNGQEAKDRTAEMGKDALGKAERLSENSTIRDIAQKIEDVSWSASDKMKELLSSKSTREAADTVEKAGKSVMKKFREVVDPPQKGE